MIFELLYFVEAARHGQNIGTGICSFGGIMIYTVTLNPALDKTVEIPSFTVDTVNRIAAMRTDPGGKGINVSKVIQKLGSVSIAMGILAGNVGRMILGDVQKMGIETDFVFQEGETRTNLKIADPVCHTNTDINEPGFPYSGPALSALLENLLGRIKKGDIVIFSGSVPKDSPKDTYRSCIAACREKGAKVILDADGIQMAEGIKASPYLIKPNHRELEELMGKELDGVDKLEEAARELMRQFSIRKVTVSMGRDGALYLTENETIYAEGLDVPVQSTVGAGDSVVAALAVAEEKGMSPEETARLLTAVGAANVMSSGTQAAEYETVQKLLSHVVIRKR